MSGDVNPATLSDLDNVKKGRRDSTSISSFCSSDSECNFLRLSEKGFSRVGLRIQIIGSRPDQGQNAITPSFKFKLGLFEDGVSRNVAKHKPRVIRGFGMRLQTIMQGLSDSIPCGHHALMSETRSTNVALRLRSVSSGN